MSELVDARGLACPAPVVKTRDAAATGALELEVLVDNATSRDNVSRFAISQGFSVTVHEEEGCFRLALSRDSFEPVREVETAVSCATTGGRGTVVVLSSDIMGHGDEELGRILVKALLNTLAESGTPPWRTVLFNRGALLAVEGADTVEALSNLRACGVEVLVCGTCLDFFGFKDKVAVGVVSNMYEIMETMLMATNSITV